MKKALAGALLAIAIVMGPMDAEPPSRPSQDAVEPPPGWNLRRANDLLAVIEGVRSHGLNPADYDPAALRGAIATGDTAAIARESDVSFVRLATDLALGKLARDPPARRFGGLTPFDTERVMAVSLVRDDVKGALETLAPQDWSYFSLRNALGSLPLAAPLDQRDALVATLERMRWMPRIPQGRHIVVNIPAFRLDLFDGKTLVESHRVIVGKATSPTPQLPAAVEAVTINPSWFVPESIVKESVGALIRTNPAAARAKGYVWKRDANGTLSVVQSPGEQNALGRVKLELPNAFRVYIHDTPDRELFDRSVRAFSHGCIRVADPNGLAATLLEAQGWDIAKVERAIAGGKSLTVRLGTPVPVEVVYFTAEPSADGRVRYWPDIYGLDQEMAERIEGRQSDPKAASAEGSGCAALS